MLDVLSCKHFGWDTAQDISAVDIMSRTKSNLLHMLITAGFNKPKGHNNEFKCRNIAFKILITYVMRQNRWTDNDR